MWCSGVGLAGGGWARPGWVGLGWGLWAEVGRLGQGGVQLPRAERVSARCVGQGGHEVTGAGQLGVIRVLITVCEGWGVGLGVKGGWEGMGAPVGDMQGHLLPQRAATCRAASPPLPPSCLPAADIAVGP